jgi:hypothetical protein
MTNKLPNHDLLSTSYMNGWSGWYMVDKKWVCYKVFSRVHPKSFNWLNNDSHVGHVTQSELGRHHSRLMSSLGQWVIDTMVGMDKDSSSVTSPTINALHDSTQIHFASKAKTQRTPRLSLHPYSLSKSLNLRIAMIDSRRQQSHKNKPNMTPLYPTSKALAGIDDSSVNNLIDLEISPS